MKKTITTTGSRLLAFAFTIIIFFVTVITSQHFEQGFSSTSSGSINPYYKWAWSENSGWLNFNTSNSNVVVTDSSLTGYVWSANHGWINLAPAGSGVSNDSAGTLSGSAWGENTGWIDFSGVTIDESGFFHGTATGDVTGDIVFNCEDTPTNCNNYDFKLRTDWRPAADRITFVGEVELTSTEVSATNVRYIVRFTPEIPVPNGGTVNLTFPTQYSLTGLSASDIAVTSTYLQSTDTTIDTTNRIIRIHVNSSRDLSSEIFIVIGDGISGGYNDLSNPSTEGLYGIGIDTFDSFDQELNNGIGYAAIESSAIDISALVPESLIMTISASNIYPLVDPTSNSGKDTSQYTQLTVATNANNGYYIYGKLDDGSGNAQLVSGSDSIPSGTGENSIGYEAKNSAYSSAEVVDADASFSNTSTILNSNSANIGNSTYTNQQKHTVYYDIDVDYLTPAGYYTGTVTYTIVAGF